MSMSTSLHDLAKPQRTKSNDHQWSKIIGIGKAGFNKLQFALLSSRVAKWNLTSSYDANVSFGTNVLEE